ncbi:MAG: hypothetical protein AAGK97_10925 [Bacteroidota bacterium]
MKLRYIYLILLLSIFTACTSSPEVQEEVKSEYDLQAEAIEKVSEEINQFTESIIEDRSSLEDAVNDLEMYK